MRLFFRLLLMNTTIARWLAAAPLPRNEARMLLQQLTGYSRSCLITRDDEPLNAHQLTVLSEWVKRRQAGEPMAYILGWRGFYGRDFKVSPAVLIPRPETEHLLEAALDRLPENGRAWDLGTGSGILAVSLKLERPDACVLASDISSDALAVARENAAVLGADITWAQGSWLDVQPPPNGRMDMLLSNPPYIEADDVHLTQGDLRFEPPHALSDFADGLTAYRTITAGARQFLRQGGWLLFEHGWNQAAAVRALLHENGFEAVETLPDLAGHERVTLGRAA